MIYIKEEIHPDQLVHIYVDGILNSESLPVFIAVLELKWKEGYKIFLHTDKLLHVSREGRRFLREIEENIEPTHDFSCS